MNHSAEDSPKISKALDKFILGFGETVSWLNVILICVIILQVILRYVFGRGLVVLEELQWHLYGVGIIIGLSYCLTNDSHIRLDLLHERLSRRSREKVEIFGILFLLMPLIIVIFLHSIDFLGESWRVSERSDSPVGLPARYIIKSVIPIGFILFFMAAMSRLIRAFSVLRQRRGK